MSESKLPWRTLLFVSAALNMLAVGAVAGAVGAGVRFERETPAAVVDRMPGPRAFMAALPPETRTKMRGELADSWQQTREARRAARQARRDAFEAAAVEPYDAERVRSALARLRAADQAAIGVFHDNIAGAFARLSPEERRQAMAALRRAPPATRSNVAPAEDGANEGAIEDRGTFREKMRERRRERRERRLQQQQP
jgi:uncharacterized membrane protein